MKSIKLLLTGAVSLSSFMFSCGQDAPPPVAVGPTPSENQLRWQEMEYYAFIHFSVNTYTDMSWGFGNEDPAIFNPENLDVRQWARVAKEAGMTGIILTAKHHSGFCLWPSAYTDYDMTASPYKDGKGDIVKELSEACKEYGLKFGVYLSPWDRNYPDYGKPEYITYFRNQLRELLTNYGEIFEVWYDGANGGSGYYGGANETRKIDRRTYYDWPNTYKLVRELQPNIVIWNDGGDRADLRWVGTESGYVGETNWSLLNAQGDVPEEMLRHGVEEGDSWVPGEVNTSIRPEWFYHPREDSKVKTLPELMDTYYNSIGRNGTLLLNFPITPEGVIHELDEKAVLEFAQAVKEVFDEDLAINAKAEATNVRGRQYGAEMALDGDKETYWTTEDKVKTASLVIDFERPTTFNRFLVQEYIRLGQRVKAFTIEAMVDGEWKELDRQTTIGYKRILRFPTIEATKLRFTITDSKPSPVISTIGVYEAPQILTAPTIIREQPGTVVIHAADQESTIYYTLDGSIPTPESQRYAGPFPVEGKVEVAAIAYDPQTRKNGPVTREQFDIARKNWKILGVEEDEEEEEERVLEILDGNPNTVWHQPKPHKLPYDLVIDLGKTEELRGFRYLPDQNLWSSGIISEYEFYVSKDNKTWKKVSSGEFANIKNNPLWQSREFAVESARYIKFRALKNTQDDEVAGFAEIDVITK